MKVSEKEQKRIKAIHEIAEAKVKTIEGYKPQTTFLVTDYLEFEHTEANRAVLPNKELLENLKKNGQLMPVTVKKNESEKLVIIDGQHRTFHLKELGLPVICLELQTDFKGNDFDAVKATNIVDKSFTNKDLSQHYIVKGNTNFKNFEDAKKAYKFLSETILYTQYAKDAKIGLKEVYKTEVLNFDLTETEKNELESLNKFMEAIEDSRADQPFNIYFNRPEIFKILRSFITENSDFDKNTLDEVLKKEGHKFSKTTTVEEIFTMYQKQAILNEEKAKTIANKAA